MDAPQPTSLENYFNFSLKLMKIDELDLLSTIKGESNFKYKNYILHDCTVSCPLNNKFCTTLVL